MANAIAEAKKAWQRDHGSDLEWGLEVQLRQRGLPLGEREFRFDSVRKWRFDRAWPDRMLAVEIEGGTRSGGRHTRPLGFEADCEKYNAAQLAGWKVFRFPGSWVKDGSLAEFLEALLTPPELDAEALRLARAHRWPEGS